MENNLISLLKKAKGFNKQSAILKVGEKYYEGISIRNAVLRGSISEVQSAIINAIIHDEDVKNATLYIYLNDFYLDTSMIIKYLNENCDIYLYGKIKKQIKVKDLKL